MTREDILITGILMVLIAAALAVWAVMQRLRQRKIKNAAKQSGWQYCGESSLPEQLPDGQELLATGPYGIGQMLNTLYHDGMWLFDYVQRAVKLEGRNRRLGTYAIIPLKNNDNTQSAPMARKLYDPETGQSFRTMYERQANWAIIGLRSTSNRPLHVRPEDIPAFTRALDAFRHTEDS